MTREEAINLLICEKVCVEDVDGNIGGERVRQAYDMAIEALQDDWIPVTKSTLPGSDVDVNVTIKDFAETQTGFLSDEDWWLITKEGMLENYPLEYVVAWRPLPEPYKGGDTE